MKYLLLNMENVNEEINDFSKDGELTNEKFEELVRKTKGSRIINSTEDFEAQFNSEFFSTEVHQLRIVNTQYDGKEGLVVSDEQKN